MSGAVENTQKNRNRAARAARWLRAACEPLENRRLLSEYGQVASVAGFIPFPNGENPQAAVTFDAGSNLWGTTSNGGPNGYGTVFEIANGSSTITTVASFNGTNGANPYAGVTFDTSGNLWGTTYGGGAGGEGTVFEIANGSSAVTIIASFNGINGKNPEAGVTFDASGNLWGTTYGGGASNYGTVFEITKGSSTITTVISFSGNNGKNPATAVTFDAGGNLWGTTYGGGTNSYGTIFEIPKGSSTISLSISPSASSGGNPEAPVTFDASGNLWGTTYNGGSGSVGTIFEIAKGSATLTTVVALDSYTGLHPQAAVTFDASGNLWGTTYNGGSGSVGTVFEIAKGSSSITFAASFSGSNGGNPVAAVTFDSSGNLWGTTYNGGSGSIGTIFEIAKGSNTITAVANFNGTSGEYPQDAVTFDASGNLWGTTIRGGSSNGGSVFEISNGSSAITTVASFNGSNGQYPYAAVTFDTSGNLWGTTAGGGANQDGTVFEIVKGTSTITSVASFSISTGLFPYGGATFDSNGNLWGATNGGGMGGTVFEVVKGSSSITRIAGIGSYSYAGVTFDSSGNLWGTTLSGGANNDGSVFELAKGSTTVTTVASFNGSNGMGLVAPVTFDGSGNLWGTTTGGGTSGFGTVFKIGKGSSAITSVASFNGSNGKSPEAGVTFDASGNLWGTTYNGGSGSLGNVFEIAKGSSNITSVASFNGSAEVNPLAAVTLDASGNLWGTTDYGGPANAGTIWELSLLPTWLSDPAGNDSWNTASHTLIVNDPSTIIADPGSDQPIIEANGSSAVVTINPSSALQIHLGGLSLTNGASAVVTSLAAARTATNHRVLVLGLPGAASAPLFTIDPTSKLDLTDNDLVDHDGSLSSVAGLLTSGFSSGWTGDGIVSSKAGGSAIYALGASQPVSAGTFDSETVGTSDVEVRYTYYGDANLDGHVDGSDYSKIDSGLLNHLTGWSNGDLNYDGVINGSDYTLIDNAFNTQGASLAASIAPPHASTAAEMVLPSAAPMSKGGAVRPTFGGKAFGRLRTASFADIFSTKTPIALTESPEQSIELSIQKRDLLDQLSFAQ